MLSAMGMNEVDPFAAAVGEEPVDDLFPWPAEAATAALDDGAPLPRLGVDVAAKASGTRATSQASNRVRLPKAKNKARAAITSKLKPVQPDEKPELNTYLTIFVSPSTDRGSAPARKRARLSSANLVPVSIWPQYTISGVSGQFVLVTPSETWLSRMLQTMRCRNASKNAVNTTRTLVRNLWEALRVMLRKARANAPSLDDSDTLDDSSDDDGLAQKPKRVLPVISGLQCVALTTAGLPFTVLNSGKVFILQLDADGMRFINTVLVDTIRLLSDSTPTSTQEDTAVAAYRFDDSTPNVRDKVVWDPDANSWKLLLKVRLGDKLAKPIKSLYVDVSGQSLQVSENLSASRHNTAKIETYGRALRAWNQLDASHRQRITLPLPITLQGQYMESQQTEESQTAEPTTTGCGTLDDKWD